jgi:hypothetical protein
VPSCSSCHWISESIKALLERFCYASSLHGCLLFDAILKRIVSDHRCLGNTGGKEVLCHLIDYKGYGVLSTTFKGVVREAKRGRLMTRCLAQIVWDALRDTLSFFMPTSLLCDYSSVLNDW